MQFKLVFLAALLQSVHALKCYDGVSSTSIVPKDAETGNDTCACGVIVLYNSENTPIGKE